jgi:ketol-acid reductoisomerase
MVAPMGPGPEVRSSYQAGSGIASLIAIKQDAEDGLRIALALAKGCGLLKKGCLECSFEQETIQDLFSEQAVLCGGMVELIKMAFNTLVENGYPEELAYFCLHESNLITKLLTKHGIEGMYGKVSNTAEYGGRKVGKFLINDKVRGNMEKVLNNVKNGDFVKDFLDDYDAGFEKLKLLREKSKSESIEKVGKDLRKFINK